MKIEQKISAVCLESRNMAYTSLKVFLFIVWSTFVLSQEGYYNKDHDGDVYNTESRSPYDFDPQGPEEHLEQYNDIGEWAFETASGVQGTLNASNIDLHLNKHPNKRSFCPVCQCGVPNTQARIIGGQPVGKNELPWLALMQVSGRFSCGATLISDRHVVTSLGCTKFPLSNIRIVLLEHNRYVQTGQEIYRRVDVVYRPKFPYKEINRNIAVIKLRKTVPIGNRVLRPVCLPKSVTRSYAYQIGVAAGWGFSSANAVSGTAVPYKVALRIRTADECNMYASVPGISPQYVMCAGPTVGPRGFCKHDQGGPLTVRVKNKHVLVGVISKPMDCEQDNVIDIFTRVNRFLLFLKIVTIGSCFCGA